MVVENSKKPILVTSYVHPDLDGLSGAFAYAEFLQKSGKAAVAKILEKIHGEAKYVLDRFDFEYPEVIDNTDGFDDVILVDTSDLISPEKVIEIIDHRKITKIDQFPKAQVQIEFVGAVATVITEKFIHAGFEMSKKASVLLYAAIVSNTLNFNSSTTTERDIKAASWLNKIAQLPESFWKELFVAKSDLSGTKIADEINGNFTWFQMADKKVGIAQLEILGANTVVSERTNEILELLKKIKDENGLDFIFQNIIGLEEGKTFFITQDEEMQAHLQKAFAVRFERNIAEREGLILRKEIVPLLKAHLEQAQRVQT